MHKDYQKQIKNKELTRIKKKLNSRISKKCKTKKNIGKQKQTTTIKAAHSPVTQATSKRPKKSSKTKINVQQCAKHA